MARPAAYGGRCSTARPPDAHCDNYLDDAALYLVALRRTRDLQDLPPQLTDR